MNLVLAIVFGATFGLNPVANDDAPVLEPSIRNEVDHAIASGERWLAKNAPLHGRVCGVTGNCLRDVSRGAKEIFDSTNGLSRTRIAIKLISSQRGEGWWVSPTNAAPTRAAIQILKGL